MKKIIKGNLGECYILRGERLDFYDIIMKELNLPTKKIKKRSKIN